MHFQHAVHTFQDLVSSGFSPEQYSRLKFGQNSAAREFGYALADSIFARFGPELLSNRCVVIPSPYNQVKNAASIMTDHFARRLNHILTLNSGEHCDTSVIHRKVSYISDYGFLDAEQRKRLIDGDDFYFNPEFYKDKILIFIDDVRITGTHEIKLKELLEKHGIENTCIFGYYALYEGQQADIEAAINFAGMKGVDDLIALIRDVDNYHMIVRPIKYILGSCCYSECSKVLSAMTDLQLSDLYFGCLGEGYYKIPKYQPNFQHIKNAYTARLETILIS